MNKKNVIKRYIDSWLKGDLKGILTTLTNTSVIIESDGSTYKGKRKITKWVTDWIKNGNTVNNWTLLSFYETRQATVFEWDFTCTVKGIHHKIQGISIAKFKRGKIIYLREYRTTKPGIKLLYN